jgi:hypothetical protein
VGLECRYFVGIERAPLTGLQITQQQAIFPYPNKLLDSIPQYLCNLTYLPLPPLMQHHPHPGSVVRWFQQINLGRSGSFAIKLYSSTPRIQSYIIWRPIQQHLVFFLYLKAGMRQTMHQRTIISKEKQSFTL